MIVAGFFQNAGTYLPHYMMPHPEDSNIHNLQKNLTSQQFHFLWHVIETVVSTYYGCVVVCVYIHLINLFFHFWSYAFDSF